MAFLQGLFRQPISCNEMLRYMVQEASCFLFCFEGVPTDYISIVVVCLNMSDNVLTVFCGLTVLCLLPSA